MNCLADTGVAGGLGFVLVAALVVLLAGAVAVVAARRGARGRGAANVLLLVVAGALVQGVSMQPASAADCPPMGSASPTAGAPSGEPSGSAAPSQSPSESPSESGSPSVSPSASPTSSPTAAPTSSPTPTPTPSPTETACTPEPNPYADVTAYVSYEAGAYTPDSTYWSLGAQGDALTAFWDPAQDAAITQLITDSAAGAGTGLTLGSTTVTISGPTPGGYTTQDLLLPNPNIGPGAVSVGIAPADRDQYLPGAVAAVVSFTFNDGCADHPVALTFLGKVNPVELCPVNDKSATSDTDADGVVDRCDADSDNDGLPDTVEDLDLNGRFEDDDIDGNILCIPVLGDSISSYLDLDSENDSALDLFESGIADALIDQIDADHNGVIDLSVPVGANGLADVLETSPDSGAINYTVANLDGDDKYDFLDIDSDGASLDLYLIGNASLDLLGCGFLTPIVDIDPDGIMDQVDSDTAAQGSPNSPLPTW